MSAIKGAVVGLAIEAAAVTLGYAGYAWWQILQIDPLMGYFLLAEFVVVLAILTFLLNLVSYREIESEKDY